MKQIKDGDTPKDGSFPREYACTVFDEAITAPTRGELQKKAQAALDSGAGGRVGRTHRFAVMKGDERRTDLVLEKAKTERVRRIMCYSCR